ncbi:MAG: GNAT family N-acetyltransferase [Thermoflexales bacterium]
MVAGIEVRPMRIGDAEACEALDRGCFPTVDPSTIYTAKQFRHHLGLFSEGQWVADDVRTGLQIGFTSTLRINIDFASPHLVNVYQDTDHGWFNTHIPGGAHLYGADMCISTAYRGLGIAREFYDRRKSLCRALGLAGQVVCGLIPGYSRHRREMTAYEYVNKVIAGELHDLTLTTQLRNGFVARGLLPEYVHDDVTGGWAVLLEWRNPDRYTGAPQDAPHAPSDER